MLSMSASEYARIRNEYPDAMDGDDAINFVIDLLHAEAEATRQKWPAATATIRRLEAGEEAIKNIAPDLMYGNFEEENENG